MRKEMVLIIAAILVYIAAYNFYEYMPYYYFGGLERKPFYYMSSFALFLVSMSVFSLSKKNPIAFIFMAFTFNNLLDDLFFKFGDFQFTEYVLAAIIIIYTVISHFKRENEKNITT